MNRTLKLALLQLPAVTNGEDAWPQAAEAIESAASQGANLVVLPELFRTPYFCQTMDTANFRLAEEIGADTCKKLQQIASRLNIVVVGSIFERAMAGLYYNTAVIYDSQAGLVGTYRKTHIPDDPGYYEKFYFTPGDLGYRIFNTSAGSFGVLICWDQWFPEAARALALRGAQLIVYPSAIGTLPHEDADEKRRQIDAWRSVQRGHAIANGMYIAAVNRVGQQDQLDFWGHSFVYGPQGEMIAQSGEEPSVICANIDPTHVETIRNIWPFFRDRRIDLCDDLARRQIEE